MVPGDYYVARVRPTGWLLRPRVLSLSLSLSSISLASAVLFLRYLLSVFVRFRTARSLCSDVRIYMYIAHVRTLVQRHVVRIYVLESVDTRTLGGDLVNEMLSERKKSPPSKTKRYYD